MRATEILEQEHRVIEQVLSCVEKMAGIARDDGRIDGAPAKQAVEFLRAFADRCHHAKEEERLFPLMETKGFSPESGPTAVMRMEHVQGRELIARMDAAIEVPDPRAFAEAATGYVELLREHIQKEDHCLFPMADRALSGEEQAELLQTFRRVDGEQIGDEAHERNLRIADELAERFGVSGTATRDLRACQGS